MSAQRLKSITRNKISNKAYLRLPPLGLALSACGGEETHSTGSVSSFSSFGLTNNLFRDATTQGSYWTPSDNVLTYAVANGFNGEAWNNISFVNDQLAKAMENFAYFTDITVQNLGNFNDAATAANAGATIVLSLDGEIISANLGDSTWGVGFFPNTVPVLYNGSAGDIFLNTNSAGAALTDQAYEEGGQGYTFLLHELGHTLGLKHPHDDGGSGRPTYAEAGYTDFDDQSYTVMAYEDEFGSVTNAPGTFMVIDALALMDLYGVNNFTNAGDTVHHMREADVRYTIWDASGIDTIDLSLNNNSVVVYLSAVKPNNSLDVSFGFVTVNAFTPDAKVNWLLGDYENVSGGSGNDIIDGNIFDNVIRGNAGNDVIDGWGGDDTLFGGLGADTFVKGIGEGNDIIKDFDTSADVCHFYNASLTREDAIATLSSTRDGYALYTLTDNTTLLLEGILYTDFAAIA